MSVLKRQREAAKRARERSKAEKQALKRERRHGTKKAGPQMASREELAALGLEVGGVAASKEDSADAEPDAPE